MKRIVSILVLVAVALLVAGCPSATSSTPVPADISTAPAASADKFGKVIGSVSLADLDNLPLGIDITGSYSNLSAVDAIITFANYTSDDGFTYLNGSVKLTGSMNASPAILHESGSITISGTGGVSGTVSFNWTITTTNSGQTVTIKIVGTCTIDGVPYSVNQSTTF
jgi:hypothetical protein